MTVYCYYEELDFPGQVEQVELWERSWRQRGWTPRVLTLDDAKRSDMYEAVSNAASRVPTVNHRSYSNANFVRYAALEAVGGGLFTDYDCVNYALTPEHVWSICKQTVVRLHLGGFIWLTHKAVRDQNDYFVDFVDKGKFVTTFNGQPHYSDVEIQDRLYGVHLYDLCRLYLEYGWWRSPVVHFSNDSIIRAGSTPDLKASHIMKVRPV